MSCWTIRFGMGLLAKVTHWKSGPTWTRRCRNALPLVRSSWNNLGLWLRQSIPFSLGWVIRPLCYPRSHSEDLGPPPFPWALQQARFLWAILHSEYAQFLTICPSPSESLCSDRRLSLGRIRSGSWMYRRGYSHQHPASPMSQVVARSCLGLRPPSIRRTAHSPKYLMGRILWCSRFRFPNCRRRNPEPGHWFYPTHP